MNTNFAFTEWFTENPFWFEQLDLRQSRVLRRGSLILEVDAAYICCLYITTMKAINFQDDTTSIPVDNLNGHYVIVFDLISMQ